MNETDDAERVDQYKFDCLSLHLFCNKKKSQKNIFDFDF